MDQVFSILEFVVSFLGTAISYFLYFLLSSVILGFGYLLYRSFENQDSKSAFDFDKLNDLNNTHQRLVGEANLLREEMKKEQKEAAKKEDWSRFYELDKELSEKKEEIIEIIRDIHAMENNKYNNLSRKELLHFDKMIRGDA